METLTVIQCCVDCDITFSAPHQGSMGSDNEFDDIYGPITAEQLDELQRLEETINSR